MTTLRKTVSLVLALATIGLAVLTSAYAKDIEVYLDKTKLNFDVPPQIISGRTMVPMRGIFEALGYEVEWTQETQTIMASKGKQFVVMKVGVNAMNTTDASGGSKTEQLDVPPQIVDGRTLVPVRAISEASGLDVKWNESTQSVIIGENSGLSVVTPVYEDITANINQINYFISQGKYAKAIKECDNANLWHKLSQEDINKVNDLRELAFKKAEETYKYKLVSDDLKKKIYDIIKADVSRSLRSPSTAIWPQYTEAIYQYEYAREVPQYAGSVAVFGNLEAMNGFGGYGTVKFLYYIDEDLNIIDRYIE